MYNISYRKFIKRNLPGRLRRTKLMDWVYALTKQLRVIDDKFALHREEVRGQYEYNGLIHSMEWNLNDKFDPVLRRIYITVVDKIPVLFLRDDGEQPEAYLQDDGQIADYFVWDPEDINETTLVDYEFRVMVHAAIWSGQSVLEMSNSMLEMLSVHRFGGLRPRIFRYGAGEVEEEVETTYELGG